MHSTTIQQNCFTRAHDEHSWQEYTTKFWSHKQMRMWQECGTRALWSRVSDAWNRRCWLPGRRAPGNDCAWWSQWMLGQSIRGVSGQPFCHHVAWTVVRVGTIIYRSSDSDTADGPPVHSFLRWSSSIFTSGWHSPEHFGISQTAIEDSVHSGEQSACVFSWLTFIASIQDPIVTSSLLNIRKLEKHMWESIKQTYNVTRSWMKFNSDAKWKTWMQQQSYVRNFYCWSPWHNHVVCLL